VDLFLDPDAPVEADQIRAAAEEHVLAVVDDLIDAWMAIRACPATKIAPPLNEGHLESAVCKTTGSAHSGHASADYDHRFFRDWRQVIPFLDFARASPIIADGGELPQPEQLGKRTKNSFVRVGNASE
jgi:ectoine hydroxylase-related dioxygenase (phytanoyl-CoA dioxygenase family)